MPPRISVSAAAKLAERDATTIRRWLRAGKLTAHEGDPPPTGGKPPTLVDQAELMTHLAISGAQPRPLAEPSNEHERLGAPEHEQAPANAGATATAAELEAAELRGRLVAAEAHGRAERLAAELEAAKTALAVSENRVEELREERDDWRERHDARQAEVKALRSTSGVPWYRRLLPGPIDA